MRVLVIGGTQFVGRAVVERLLARGHQVTLLNRGQSAPGLFADLDRITADRRELRADMLAGQSWDVVIDTSAYYPAEVETAVEALRGRVRRYVLCSTGSVYAAQRPYPVSEDTEMKACTPEQAVDAGMETYGARKAECERRLLALGATADLEVFIGRPMIVYGPHDTTDRMHFWMRAVRQGRVIIPGDGLEIFHSIFVGDLAALFVSLAEADATLAGTYNLAGTELYTLNELVESLATLTATTPEVVHVPASQLIQRGVRPQFDVPLWLGGTHFIADVARVRERLGFRSTPLLEALRVTLEAFEGRPEQTLSSVMEPEKVWALAHE